jgi:tetratricopeptide (TPR) repeat protein
MAAAGLHLALGVGVASADSLTECLSEASPRRIEACTEMLDTPGLAPRERSLAYSMRALAYSLRADYSRAMPDYDRAIDLDPDAAIALNNRAWTLLKLGQPEKGLGDVERSLALAPDSSHAHDTRGHILQALGRPAAALGAYERAMLLGGERMIRLYQCGLQAEGLYRGPMSGLFTSALRLALSACVKSSSCDPLPADEDCRYTTS